MNTANILTATMPTLAVLLGILWNRHEMMALRMEIKSDMAELRREIKSDMADLRSEMFQLRDSIHRDMIGLHERIAVVEARQAS